MKINILAFAAHPDDAELCCGGTLMQQISLGKTAGIIDLTKGELGTRGNAETRMQEAELASKILGIHVRENLHFADGFFENDPLHQLAIIKIIRKYTPDIILANAVSDRHPDHGRAAKLVSDACFLSGLPKIITYNELGIPQAPHRPQNLFHYVQDYLLQPSFVVDITPFIDKKIACIKAYSSQFYNPSSTEKETYISSSHFIDAVLGTAMAFGKNAFFKYAEAYTVSKIIGVEDISVIR